MGPVSATGAGRHRGQNKVKFTLSQVRRTGHVYISTPWTWDHITLRLVVSGFICRILWPLFPCTSSRLLPLRSFPLRRTAAGYVRPAARGHAKVHSRTPSAAYRKAMSKRMRLWSQAMSSTAPSSTQDRFPSSDLDSSQILNPNPLWPSDPAALGQTIQPGGRSQHMGVR